MKKNILWGALLFAAIASMPGDSQAQTAFAAQLERGQVVAAISAPEGTGSFTLNADETELTYEIRVQGIPNISAAHFHGAVAGENGGVVHPLSGNFEGDVWVSQGVWLSADADQPLTAELVQQLKAGAIYVNVHTPDYPSGEIRGQVTGDGTAFDAQLERGQVVAAISAPEGTGSFTLNADETELTYEIRVQGIPNISVAHFHGAVAGENGGVVHPLSGDFEGDVWVSQGNWSGADADQPLTAELVQQLKAGAIYVNVHTPDYPSGEVRGQVLLTGTTAIEGTTWGAVKMGIVR